MLFSFGVDKIKSHRFFLLENPLLSPTGKKSFPCLCLQLVLPFYKGAMTFSAISFKVARAGFYWNAIKTCLRTWRCSRCAEHCCIHEECQPFPLIRDPGVIFVVWRRVSRLAISRLIFKNLAIFEVGSPWKNTFDHFMKFGHFWPFFQLVIVKWNFHEIFCLFVFFVQTSCHLLQWHHGSQW